MIVLMSDFGMADGYVAAMKGVIASVSPGIPVIDATHDIAPQDIAAGAWALANYAPFYPEGTIHVAVVDPGVGTKRALVLVEAGGQRVLAPNNGLLSIWLGSQSGYRAWELKAGWHRPGGSGATFHGRDILAYAAARLSVDDLPPDILTELKDPLVQLTESRVVVKDDCIIGQVVHIDRFGNAITAINSTHLAPLNARRIKVELPYGDRIPIKTAYGHVPRGSSLALINSSDRLEVAIHAGNASLVHGLVRGSEVKVVF